MKELFLAIREQLLGIEEFIFIDKDKGQLLQPNEHGRYPVNFPCALFSLESQSRNESENGSIQRVTVTVSITMAWQFQPMADGFVSDEVLQESLGYYDAVESLQEKLQGFTTEVKGQPTNEFNELFFREENGDKITVAQTGYQTSFIRCIPKASS